MTFDQAKKQARVMLADAMRGEDPVEIRKTARRAPSIADLAADYLERHAVPKKRPKSVRDDRSMLDNIILPNLGAKKVDAIGRRDLEAIQVAMKKRERWLSDEELRHLCAMLDEHPNTRAANAVRLQLLTGARLGEVLTSSKEDFDLHRGIWTKPSLQTKQKRTEHLPLSAQALALIASIIERSDPDSSFLFPGNKPGRPLREIKNSGGS